MVGPFLRRWARLSIPVGMVVVGLAFRLAGVVPGWSTLLILGGIIGGALVAYVILLGEHERPIEANWRTAEAKVAQLDLYGNRFTGGRGSGYDRR